VDTSHHHADDDNPASFIQSPQERRPSAEGNALDEIRVTASPNWDAAKVTVFFWFLLEPESVADFDSARRVIGGWMKMVTFSGPFSLADPAFDIVEPQDMTAADYLNSHALDYDDVSP
jgi:hypothetical protein